MNLMSNTNIESDSGLGVVHIDGAGQGTDNYVVASNGLKFVNSENDAGKTVKYYLKLIKHLQLLLAPEIFVEVEVIQTH